MSTITMEAPATVTAVQSLVGVIAAVQPVGKNSRNEEEGYNYRSVDDIINAVHPALRQVGGFILGQEMEQVASTVERNGQTLTTVRLKVMYEWHGTDGGDPIASLISSEATSDSDGATGKAWSVAYRTYLVQVLCLPSVPGDQESELKAKQSDRKPVDDVPGVAADITTDWAALAASCKTREQLRPIYNAVEAAQELGVTLDDGRTVQQLLWDLREVLPETLPPAETLEQMGEVWSMNQGPAEPAVQPSE